MTITMAGKKYSRRSPHVTPMQQAVEAYVLAAILDQLNRGIAWDLRGDECETDEMEFDKEVVEHYSLSVECLTEDEQDHTVNFTAMGQFGEYLESKGFYRNMQIEFWKESAQQDFLFEKPIDLEIYPPHIMVFPKRYNHTKREKEVFCRGIAAMSKRAMNRGV